MIIIEFTEEQRRALQAEAGRPLEVIDPATKQAYVIVALEKYERVRSFFKEASSGIPVGRRPARRKRRSTACAPATSPARAPGAALPRGARRSRVIRDAHAPGRAPRGRGTRSAGSNS